MLFNIPLLEWIGYLGSIVVAVSLTMSSIVKLRWFNLLGAAIFSFYGFAIASLPVGLLNLFIVFADIYYLYKIYSINELIKSISVNYTDSYVEYFLDFHKKEIDSFFPDFKNQSLKFNEDKPLVYLLLRNAVVAGVFIARVENEKLYIILDFVIPEFRDCKPGNFLYVKNIHLFKNQGVKELICVTMNKEHMRYLEKMGFVKNDKMNRYSKII